MKLLLDTHVVIWALEDSFRLPLEIKEEICDERNEIYVSVVSLWEISLKHKKNPEKMKYSATEIRNYCQRAGYYFLSLSVDNIATFDQIDFLGNKDTFDRILLSQSISNNMKLLTHDEKLKEYNMGYIEFF